MSVIGDLRAGAKDVLVAADVKAVDYLAETLNPPVAAVVPGDPYLDREGEDIPFGHMRVRINVLLIGAKATNKSAASQIDELIEKSIDALEDADWNVEEVGAPQQMLLNGVKHIGTYLALEQTVRIGN